MYVWYICEQQIARGPSATPAQAWYSSSSNLLAGLLQTFDTAKTGAVKGCFFFHVGSSGIP